MMDVREITIAQAHNGFRTSAFTARDLTAAFLDRIATLDKAGPGINATMALSTTALAEAEALDAHFAATSQFRGPLHGIPVLVKDQADTAGIETNYGSAATRGNVPTTDATVVRTLKAAGAVVLGKTTMAEWAASWFSANGATDYAPTKNPYNLAHDVGASSGGSGAAVAANFCILAVGEDTGGSVRVPSSFCNLVGLRPTPGLVPRTGFCPLIRTQDTPGPMARTVVDCAHMLDAMAGFDSADEFTGVAATAAALGLPRGGSYAAGLEDGDRCADTVRGARIGVLRQRFGPSSDPHCAAVNTVVDAALERLRAAGTTLVDVQLSADLDATLDFAQTYLVRSRSDINAFLATKPHLPQDIATIVPRTPVRPDLDLVSAMAHGPQDPLDDPSLAARLLARDALQRQVETLMATLRLDALALPDVQVPPPRHDDATSGRFDSAAGRPFPTNTFLASITRLPAVTVPAGFTTAAVDAGLPVGLELVGLTYTEQHLLTLARGVEVLVGGRRAPPAPL
ncbi:Amidase signature domain protein [Niveomyces insectorum RCEF 264]|uniref:Amidase signature domain protein n=1 Tax=Niveomyces insectorum RCEF 264 TaxID=1081102 RepID=A0A162JGE4_9HYPO|nr:Amidase signature domain protein [Niveomyces insectorum RCEF 264]